MEKICLLKLVKKKNLYLFKVFLDIFECFFCSFFLYKICLISVFVMGYKIWVGFIENCLYIYCVSFYLCIYFMIYGVILDCCMKYLKKVKFNLWIFIDKL